MSRRSEAIRQVAAYVSFLLLTLWLAAHCTGCAELLGRAPAAFDVAAYKAALDACREEGKRVNSLAVYTQCADEADRRHGLKDGGI
jgi:hypothetical protein